MKSRSQRPVLRLERRLEAAIVLALFDLSNHLQRRGERLASVAGLTTQQWLVLLQIAGDPNFPRSARAGARNVMASDVARTRGVGRPTVSAIVAALERRGLIREEPDPEDRRRHYLVVTRAGAKAIESIEASRHAANDRLLADVGPSERKTLLALLEQCLDVLWGIHEDEQLARARDRLAKL